jgi:hypothetical protein
VRQITTRELCLLAAQGPQIDRLALIPQERVERTALYATFGLVGTGYTTLIVDSSGPPPVRTRSDAQDSAFGTPNIDVAAVRRGIRYQCDDLILLIDCVNDHIIVPGSIGAARIDETVKWQPKDGPFPPRKPSQPGDSSAIRYVHRHQGIIEIPRHCRVGLENYQTSIPRPFAGVMDSVGILGAANDNATIVDG